MNEVDLTKPVHPSVLTVDEAAVRHPGLRTYDDLRAEFVRQGQLASASPAGGYTGF